MNYVGIDHHRQYSHLTVMDQTGQVLRSGRVANLQSEIRFSRLSLSLRFTTARMTTSPAEIL
jgi:hypothetical protein